MKAVRKHVNVQTFQLLKRKKKKKKKKKNHVQSHFHSQVVHHSNGLLHVSVRLSKLAVPEDNYLFSVFVLAVDTVTLYNKRCQTC